MTASRLRCLAFVTLKPILLAIVLSAIALTAAVAQTAVPTGTVERELEGWKEELAEIEQELGRADLTDERIDELRLRLTDIKTSTLERFDDIRPLARDLAVKLEQLGPAPEDGDESEAITSERNAITAELNAAEGLIKQLEVNVLATDQLSNRGADIERTRFIQGVFEPSNSILDPALWANAWRNISTLFERLTFLVRSWFNLLLEGLTLGGWIALAAAVLGLFVLIGPFRIWVIRTLVPSEAKETPSDLDVIWRACWVVIVNCATVLLGLLLVYMTLERMSDGLSSRMDEILIALFDAIMLFVLIASVGLAITAPRRRAWRLAAVSDTGARFLSESVYATAFIAALSSLWTDLSAKLYLPLDLIVAQRAIIIVLILAVLIVILLRTRKDDVADDTIRSASARARFTWFVSIRPLMWLLALLVAAALVTGYIAFAGFVTSQVVITILLVAIIYMLHHLTDEVMTTGLERGRVLGDFLRSVVSLGDRGVERFGLIVSTLVDVLLLFVGLPFIVAQWAVTWIDLKSWITTAFFGFRVGDVTISLSTILIAVSVLAIGVIVTRLCVYWFDNRFLSRTHIDRGVRNSLKTGAGYLGFVIAALIAVTYAGLDFTNVAIVAGALSVGIGFGLQSIVNNFVSGLILLAERPIRVGDWIAVGGEQGYVKRINVRSTEIETFERSLVVVPNSDLIAGTVKNWTFDKMGRVVIPVGVSYDSDPEQVRDILLKCAEEQTEVRRHPEPYVLFADFGASSLDFELRCYIVDVEYMLTVGSNLRFAIFKALRENGVEIPFPQHDIHLKDMDRIERSMSSPSPARSQTTSRATKGD